MKKATVGFLAGTGSAIIMGLSWYATKRISQISGAFIIDVLATRYLISGGVLLLLWVLGKIRLHFEKKDIVPLLGLSLLMPVSYNILEYTAINRDAMLVIYGCSISYGLSYPERASRKGRGDVYGPCSKRCDLHECI